MHTYFNAYRMNTAMCSAKRMLLKRANEITSFKCYKSKESEEDPPSRDSCP